MISRLKYGKIVERGELTSERREEFQRVFSGYDEAAIDITHSFCAVPPTAPYIHSRNSHTADGESAWDALEQGIQEEIGKYSRDNLGKIPFFFAHRQKSGADLVIIEAGARHMLGSHHIFKGKISARGARH